MARDFIMSKPIQFNYQYEPEVVYGDSVTGDTPLIIKYADGHIDIQTIDSITQEWVPYENFKPWDADRYEKEQSFIDAQVWADGEWAKINRVIRHKTNKKLYRVITPQGCIDVTEDHSLLDINGNKIKPAECIIGQTELLHSFPEISQSSNTYSVDKIVCTGKLSAQKSYYDAKLSGWNNILVTNDKDEYVLSNMGTQKLTQHVIKIKELNQSTIVYDIETEKGLFHGGVGALNVKNTDSLFIKFNIFDCVKKTESI
jgi:hypothetical protein